MNGREQIRKAGRPRVSPEKNEIWIDEVFGETPKTTCETRVLPGNGVGRARRLSMVERFHPSE
jgi:hypothetical protein